MTEGQDRHSHDHSNATQKRLILVLALTVVYTAAEVAGGILSNSLALLADAGHMLTDDLALALAVVAAWVARRPPDAGRTYGYQRAEILAALANGVALVVVCGLILWQAMARLAAPPEVATGLMAVIAAGGLVVNLIGARILWDHAGGLNARGVLLHLIGDLLGSIGALAAAGAMAAFGWRWADPVASVFIGGVIVFSSVRLVLDSIHVLMESAPAHLDAAEIASALRGLTGVIDVHDLHLWTLGGRTPLLTAHLVVDHSVRAHDVLRQATRHLRSRFGVEHVTLQIEPPDFNIVGLGPPPVDTHAPSR
ncbi:MAG TPA: cation diffusion facilitator family transporter [Candidatus Sulfotelmatobacter sp.]|nr:cation diffusion facilitator family transporter [Candidatus Sulfotelmatobacter sp.]